MCVSLPAAGSRSSRPATSQSSGTQTLHTHTHTHTHTHNCKHEQAAQADTAHTHTHTHYCNKRQYPQLQDKQVSANKQRASCQSLLTSLAREADWPRKTLHTHTHTHTHIKKHVTMCHRACTMRANNTTRTHSLLCIKIHCAEQPCTGPFELPYQVHCVCVYVCLSYHREADEQLHEEPRSSQSVQVLHNSKQHTRVGHTTGQVSTHGLHITRRPEYIGSTDCIHCVCCCVDGLG